MANHIISSQNYDSDEDIDSDNCDWCEENKWEISCNQCRNYMGKTKRLFCNNCAKLWHTRGNSIHHLVRTKDNKTFTYEDPHDKDNVEDTIPLAELLLQQRKVRKGQQFRIGKKTRIVPSKKTAKS